MLDVTELAEFREIITSNLSQDVVIRRNRISSSTTSENAGDGFGRVSKSVESRTKGYYDFATVKGHLVLRDRVGVGREALAGFNIDTEKAIAQCFLEWDTEILADDRLRFVREGETYDADDSTTFDEFYVQYVQKNTEQGAQVVMLQSFLAK